MPDYSLVPVDYQPDFSEVSLVPVDHDPFGHAWGGNLYAYVGNDPPAAEQEVVVLCKDCTQIKP